MNLDGYVEKLKKYNFKITPQRLRVVEFINDHKAHFTADDVYNSVVKIEPSITVATVYNILRAVTKSGIVTSFEANGTTWYETNMEPHVNFVCLHCGKIEDVDLGYQDIGKEISDKGYKIRNVDIIARGYCKDCTPEELDEIAV